MKYVRWGYIPSGLKWREVEDFTVSFYWGMYRIYLVRDYHRNGYYLNPRIVLW